MHWPMSYHLKITRQVLIELSKCVLLKSFQFNDISYWVLAVNLELYFMVAAGQM